MNRFDYVRASSVAEAIAALAASPDARALAGGTNLVDLMKAGGNLLQRDERPRN